MKILIDADACPVIDLTIKIARQKRLEVILLCDTSHVLQRQGITTITIPKGCDAVDFELVNRVKKQDIVITQDYGLAAMVLTKKAYAINQNGLIYSEDNIDHLLLTRHIAKHLRKSGEKTKGPRKRQIEDDKRFELQLIKLIEEASSKST